MTNGDKCIDGAAHSWIVQSSDRGESVHCACCMQCRGFDRFIRDLAKAQSEIERWRLLGKDLAHGAMLAALGKTEQSIKAERNKLKAELEAANEALVILGETTTEAMVKLRAGLLRALSNWEHKRAVTFDEYAELLELAGETKA